MHRMQGGGIDLKQAEHLRNPPPPPLLLPQHGPEILLFFANIITLRKNAS